MPVALITGASRGLGLVLARALATRDWDVVVDARGAGALEAAAASLAGAGRGEVVAIAGDVADPTHRRELVDAARARGGLDLLVNNASILGPSPQPLLAEYPMDVLERVYAVNVLAPLALVQLGLPLLRAATASGRQAAIASGRQAAIASGRQAAIASGRQAAIASGRQAAIASGRQAGGCILNVTSDAGVEGYEGWGGYGSSKAALEQWSRVLAAEQPALRVWWVDPGDMRTQMHQEAFPGEDISDRPLPDQSVAGLLRLIDEGLPSGRYRTAEVVPADDLAAIAVAEADA